MALNSFQTSGNSPGSPRCRVGVIGYGTVGSAIARRLTSPGIHNPLSHLQLTQTCDRRAREKRADVALVVEVVTASKHVIVEPGVIRGLFNHKLAEAV